MICAIMQPTYLPWAGYFNLISQADTFVFLDDVQYQKNSWHNRNRLLVNCLPHWLTVPVRRVALSQSILETELDNSKPWRIKHIKLIKQTYSKHPFADDILEICTLLEQDSSVKLAELNIKFIRWFSEKLGISTNFCLSSQMNLKGKRTLRVIDILEQLKADTYISPKGAYEYLENDRFIEQTIIKLKFQEFSPPSYFQYRQSEFVSHLSIVDIIANIGWDASKQYIY